MKPACRFLCVCLLTTLSCGSDEMGPDLSRLSGVWNGVAIYTDTSPSCRFTGGPQTVVMTWTVNDAGQLTIDQPARGATWAGTITEDLAVTAATTVTINCFGTPRTMIAAYAGTIQSDGLGDRVEIQATEEMCPPECVFDVVLTAERQQAPTASSNVHKRVGQGTSNLIQLVEDGSSQ